MLRLLPLALLPLLAACGTLSTAPVPIAEHGAGAETPRSAATRPDGYVLKRGGGFYKDDGPGDNPPENLAAIPDAEPRAEPLHRFANKPYTVLGRDYTPLRDAGRYRSRGVASWYGRRYHGQKTSTGELYDMYGMTAAHPVLPLPSYARVTSLANGKSVIVRVNDRGPFVADRLIDLSYTAAWKLGLIGGGSGLVEVESLVPGEPLPDTPAALLADAKQSPEPAEPKPLPEIADAHGAWLQLGAFGNRDNAESFKARLARELGDMADKLVVRDAGKLYRVQLGPWADDHEARAVAEKLGELLQTKPVLVNK